jgi:hypothetical protein
MRMKHAVLLWAVATTAVSSAAIAQSPPTPTTPPTPTAPSATAGAGDCSPMQPATPRSEVPEGTTTGQAREPLGDKLARSDGVLCPPQGVDPEIRAPTPNTGNTPVIPPPGSPGGDPNVRPK